MADPAKVLFRNASYDGQLMRTLAAVLPVAPTSARRWPPPGGSVSRAAPHGTAPGQERPTRRDRPPKRPGSQVNG
jgi:hypothetical protein